MKYLEGYRRVIAILLVIIPVVSQYLRHSMPYWSLRCSSGAS
jgi:hypothetical protein